MENTLADSLHFLGNIIDPTHKDFAARSVHKDFGKRKRVIKEDKEKHSATMHGPLQPASSREYAEKKMLAWMETKVIGEPESPRLSKLTVTELKEMGYVGVYRSDANETAARLAKYTTDDSISYPKRMRWDMSTGEMTSLDEAWNAQEAAKA